MRFITIKLSLFFIILSFISNCKKYSDYNMVALDFYSDPIYLSNNQYLFTVISLQKRYLVKYNLEKNEYTIFHKNLDKILYPVYSYENKKISFTAAFNNEKYSEIFIMDENGENLLQLTKSKTYSTSSLFIPKTNKILFKKYISENYRSYFYTVNIDGMNEKLLTEYNINNTTRKSISPDGNLIAFSVFTKDSSSPKDLVRNLVILDIKKNEVQTLLKNIKVATPKFLDNETIIYSGYSGNYIKDYTSSGLFKLNIKSKKLFLLYKDITEGFALDISSDKKKVLYLDYICNIHEYDIEKDISIIIAIDKKKIYDLIYNSDESIK